MTNKERHAQILREFTTKRRTLTAQYQTALAALDAERTSALGGLVTTTRALTDVERILDAYNRKTTNGAIPLGGDASVAEIAMQVRIKKTIVVDTLVRHGLYTEPAVWQ